MSLILDALRGGRTRAAPPQSNAAQTDAVLETLGYGRFTSASPLNKIKRIAALLVVGVVLAFVIWGSIIWATQSYVTTEPETQVYNVDRPAPPAAPRTVPKPAIPVDPPMPEPAAVTPAETPASKPSAAASPVAVAPVASKPATQNVPPAPPAP